jgi:hypothetical protein
MVGPIQQPRISYQFLFKNIENSYIPHSHAPEVHLLRYLLLSVLVDVASRFYHAPLSQRPVFHSSRFDYKSDFERFVVLPPSKAFR